ncbi:hypothetical protein AAG589_17865 [Isoptericola sp. F-RaC21]|uniref:hypothetical protein n=1 Tax=Isoptericola sp. F-RaC21 TaxID=3141452 RepID=UPI00315B6869
MRRVHQEDLAQALGLAAADKYERSGVSPGRLAAVARMASPEASYRIAPLYDTAPVFVVSPAYRQSGMAVIGKNRLDLITGADLVGEAMSWGWGRGQAVDCVVRTAEALVEAVDAHDAGGIPEAVPAAIRARGTSIAASARGEN